MATGTLVSVEEYLNTSYDPDCDYVDGEVLERNLGEREHSELQAELIVYLATLRKKYGFHIFAEQRVQVRPTRFRIPDICVVLGKRPSTAIFVEPPFLCIEILSKEDRYSSMREKIADYLKLRREIRLGHRPEHAQGRHLRTFRLARSEGRHPSTS